MSSSLPPLAASLTDFSSSAHYAAAMAQAEDHAQGSSSRKRKRSSPTPDGRQHRAPSGSGAPPSPATGMQTSSLRASTSSREQQVVYDLSDDDDDDDILEIIEEKLTSELMKEIAFTKARNDRRLVRIANHQRKRKRDSSGQSGSVKQQDNAIQILSSDDDIRPPPKRKPSAVPAARKVREVIDLVTDSDDEDASPRPPSHIPSAHPPSSGLKNASPVLETVARSSPAAVVANISPTKSPSRLASIRHPSDSPEAVSPVRETVVRPSPAAAIAEVPAASPTPKSPSRQPSVRPLNSGPRTTSPVVETVVRSSPAAVDSTVRPEAPRSPSPGLHRPGSSLYLANQREFEMPGHVLNSDRRRPDPLVACPNVWSASITEPTYAVSPSVGMSQLSLRESVTIASGQSDCARSPAPKSPISLDDFPDRLQADEPALTDDSDIEIVEVIENIAGGVSLDWQSRLDGASRPEDTLLGGPLMEDRTDNAPMIELSTFLQEDEPALSQSALSAPVPTVPIAPTSSDDHHEVTLQTRQEHIKDITVEVSTDLASVHIVSPGPAVADASTSVPAAPTATESSPPESVDPLATTVSRSPTPDLSRVLWPELQVHPSEMWKCAACSAVNHPDDQTCTSCNQVQERSESPVSCSVARAGMEEAAHSRGEMSHEAEAGAPRVPPPDHVASWSVQSTSANFPVRPPDISSPALACRRMVLRLEHQSKAHSFKTGGPHAKRSLSLATFAYKQRTWSSIQPKWPYLFAKAKETAKPRKPAFVTPSTAVEGQGDVLEPCRDKSQVPVDTTTVVQGAKPTSDRPGDLTPDGLLLLPMMTDAMEEATLFPNPSASMPEASVELNFPLHNGLQAQPESLEPRPLGETSTDSIANNASPARMPSSSESLGHGMPLDAHLGQTSSPSYSDGELEAPTALHDAVSEEALDEDRHSDASDSDDENEQSDSSRQGALTSNSSIFDNKTPADMSRSGSEEPAVEDELSGKWKCIACRYENVADMETCQACTLDRLNPPSEENPVSCPNTATCLMTFSDPQSFWSHICSGGCASIVTVRTDALASSSREAPVPARSRPQALRKSTGKRKPQADGQTTVAVRQKSPCHPEVRLWRNTGPTHLQNMILGLPDECQNDPNLRTVFQAHIAEMTITSEWNAPSITVANHVDRQPCPPWEFEYTDQMVYSASISGPDLDALQGCDCEGPCDPKSKTCACVRRQSRYNSPHSGFVHGSNGRLRTTVTPLVILECNSKCRCSHECQNRVIQKGRTISCEIRKTPKKGWGVFATAPIENGTFVGVYAGELLASRESLERARVYDAVGRTYLFDLDFYHLKQRKDVAAAEGEDSDIPDDSTEADEETDALYAVDAWHYGNFTRFFNHSCDPNISINAAYINETDIQKPLLAFYTRRAILPGEELSFTYTGNTGDEALKDQDDHDILAHQRTDTVCRPCHCGAANCMKFLFS